MDNIRLFSYKTERGREKRGSRVDGLELAVSCVALSVVLLGAQCCLAWRSVCGDSCVLAPRVEIVGMLIFITTSQGGDGSCTRCCEVRDLLQYAPFRRAIHAGLMELTQGG